MDCLTCHESVRPMTVAEMCPSLAGHPRASDPWEAQTLVGYESPEGHNHDDNCLSRVYICKNGHEQSVFKRRACPACDWKGKETCFCHSDVKVDEWPVEST